MSISESLSKHPKELWILAATELCERFAFWGVGNLLVLYLIEYYQFSNLKATHIYGIFTGVAAFLPLIGGWVADRWNYQAPMFIGALVNAIGCMFLAAGTGTLLYVGLVIIAIGYGIFTPSILTVLSHLYQHRPALREAGFSIYYASINVGVFLALFSLGTIAKLINWQTAFIVAASVQLIGLIPLIWFLTQSKETYRSLQQLQKESREQKGKLKRGDLRRIGVILIFCLVSILFWASYNQGFSSMAIFAHSFMNKEVGGHLIPEGIFLSSESFFLILLAPLLNGLYLKLQRKKDPTAATKTAFSFLFTAACFGAMMIASAKISPEATTGSINSGYLVGSYFLMAVGEMLLAPVGLSMVSLLAPRHLTALLIGFWYVCVGLAFYLGGLLAGLMENMGGLYHFFSLFVAMTLIPGLLLLIFSKKLTHMARFDSDEIDRTPHIPR